GPPGFRRAYRRECAVPYRGTRRSQADPHRFRLGVVVEGLAAEISSEPGKLVAPEGRRGIVEVVSIDPHRAGLDRPGDAVRLLDVLRPDACGQAVQGAVREADPLLLVVECQHRQDGAEDLLVHDLHRSEERRVGKESSNGWPVCLLTKNEIGTRQTRCRETQQTGLSVTIDA